VDGLGAIPQRRPGRLIQKNDDTRERRQQGRAVCLSCTSCNDRQPAESGEIFKATTRWHSQQGGGKLPGSPRAAATVSKAPPIANRCRENHLANLALASAVIAYQQVLYELLGYRRASFRASGLSEIAHIGADQAASVNALVLVEALVLGGNERVAHMVRKGQTHFSSVGGRETHHGRRGTEGCWWVSLSLNPSYGTSLLVAADGARSRLRERAGIATRGWSYGQSAIVTLTR
jgi:hypothetical protein